MATRTDDMVYIKTISFIKTNRKGERKKEKKRKRNTQFVNKKKPTVSRKKKTISTR